MSAVPKRPKESGNQVGCKDQGERIHLRFHHRSKGTDPDHFHGQRCKTCPKENPNTSADKERYRTEPISPEASKSRFPSANKAGTAKAPIPMMSSARA